MSSFSRDILHNILSHVPAESLLQLRVVCKLWKHVIDDPFFVKSHTRNLQSCSAGNILIRNRYNGGLFFLSLDRLSAFQNTLGTNTIPAKQLCHHGSSLNVPAPSCKGLILISHQHKSKSWEIWNPFVQDFHEIPPPPLNGARTGRLVSLGFGYDESSDDYKVVKVNIMHHGRFSKYCRSLIYSVKSRCWRELEGFPGIACAGDHGVFLNGALHWRSRYSRHKIIALHLGREDHRLVAAPHTTMCQWESLDVLDGCLIFSRGHDEQGRIDAWVMKDYESKAWTVLFTMIGKIKPRVVGYLKRKGLVFLQHQDVELLMLDLVSRCSKNIIISGFQGTSWLTFGQFSPGSLVRLDSTKSRSHRRKEGDVRVDVYATIGEKMYLYDPVVPVYHPVLFVPLVLVTPVPLIMSAFPFWSLHSFCPLSVPPL